MRIGATKELGRHEIPQWSGRPFLMDRRGDGVPIIQEETLRLAGRPAEYTLIDDSELRLVLPAASFAVDE